jgi:hypothetical protein
MLVAVEAIRHARTSDPEIVTGCLARSQLPAPKRVSKWEEAETVAWAASLPDRTSADDEHTTGVIMVVTCGNAGSVRWGRVTTARSPSRQEVLAAR